jgi:hypothetical protein
MDKDLLIFFDAALGNFCVIFAVAMVVAGFQFRAFRQTPS